MDLIWEPIQHYAVQIGGFVAITIMTLLWRVWSNILTSVFSPIKVSGNWETMMDRGSGFVRHEDATLNQFINIVWGTAVDENGMKYRHKGTLTGDRLRMVYVATSVGADGGAMLLEVFANGKEMTGFEIGIDQRTDQIYANPYKWTRRP